MDEQQKQQQEYLRLQREFWRAVLKLRNHTLVFHEADYWDEVIKGCPIEGSLWEAINIVGDHITNVIAEGVLHDGD